jgi:DNA-directed RNA polymerase specialized sigma24 family protein
MVDGIECKSVGPRVVATTPDLNTGLYIEDCRRLVASALTDSERAVIEMRYNDHMSLKQIANVLGLTHVRARQIHMEALIALREAMGGGDGADGDAGDNETEEV